MLFLFCTAGTTKNWMTFFLQVCNNSSLTIFLVGISILLWTFFDNVLLLVRCTAPGGTHEC